VECSEKKYERRDLIVGVTVNIKPTELEKVVLDGGPA